MAKKPPADLTDNALYFTAFTEETGTELYQLGRNGTPILIDINQGPDSSFPFTLTEFNGKLYFGAFTEETGAELYRLDRNGTPTLVADINEGSQSSNPTGFTEFNGKLYFRASTEEAGEELYQLGRNGTPTLIDINQGSIGSGPGSFFAL
jgi:ELWxxDGT repeat protein